MKIAVIGSGVTGLGAAWLLSHRHEVVLYERDGRLGGHANTVMTPDPDGGDPIAVDTGFIVFNDRTYPNLTALFEHIGITWRDTDMSFGVSIGDGRLEYNGIDANGFFGQRRNLLRPGHYRMLRDIFRFYREAPAVLTGPDTGTTLEAFLRDGGYGPGFVHDHLLPMAAAIWSAPLQEILGFPVQSFIRFYANHGMLGRHDRPQWRSVDGGSRRYVRRLSSGISGGIRPGAVAVTRSANGAIVRDTDRQEDRFDQVVLATHANQALALIDAPSPAERQVLGAFRYEANRAVLHTDAALMPRRRRVWSSWNYLADGRRDTSAAVSVTYWMNRLQCLETPHEFFVSLNPIREPDPTKVLASFNYEHPIYDQAAMSAQLGLGDIQGRDRLWFCGSYCGYGFHEDGLSAGLAVAEALGVSRPWSVTDKSPAGTNAAPRDLAMAVAAE